MIKKAVLLLIAFTAITSVSHAGRNYVGRDKIIPVERNANLPDRAKPITLVYPLAAEEVFDLVPMRDFLEAQKINAITANLREEDVISVVRVEKVKEPVVEQVESVEKIVPAAEVVSEVAKETETSVDTEQTVEAPVAEEAVEKVKTSEVYIAYSSAKKTLLKTESKTALKELVNKAKDSGKSIGIVTYATGEPSMAKRVALLRANIIQNTLKSYGVKEDDMEILSFGNQVNEDQSKVFLKE